MLFSSLVVLIGSGICYFLGRIAGIREEKRRIHKSFLDRLDDLMEKGRNRLRDQAAVDNQATLDNKVTWL